MDHLRLALKALLVLAVALALYLVLGSVVPTISPPEIPEALAAGFDPAALMGEGVGNDRAGLIETPDDAFGVRLALMRAAQTRIDLTTHSIHDEPTAHALLAEALDAADRGVQVRILLDGKVGMGGNTDTLLADLCGHPGITVLRYNTLDFFAPATWHALLHDKLMLVDGQYLLCGGRNLGDRYFAPAGYSPGRVAYDRDALAVRADAAQASVCDQALDYIEALLPYCSPLAPGPEAGRADGWAALRRTRDEVLAQNPAYTARDMADFAARTVATRKVTLLANPPENRASAPTLAWPPGPRARCSFRAPMPQPTGRCWKPWAAWSARSPI